jgi:hypothetical protein
MQFVEVILVIVALCHVSCQSPLIGFLFTGAVQQSYVNKQREAGIMPSLYMNCLAAVTFCILCIPKCPHNCHVCAVVRIETCHHVESCTQ